MLRREQSVTYLVTAAILAGFLGNYLVMRSGTFVSLAGTGFAMYQFQPGSSTLGHLLEFGSALLFALAGLLAIVERRAWLSGGQWFCVALMLMATLLWTVWSFSTYGVAEMLLITGSPLLWIICLGVLAGTYERVWRATTWLAFPIAALSIVICVECLGQFKSYGLVTGPSPLMYYMIDAFWATGVVLLGNKTVRWPSLLAGSLILLACFVVASLILGRSWLIQIMLLMGLVTVRVSFSSRRTFLRNIAPMVVLLVLVCSVAFRYITTTQSESYSYLLTKMHQDNRSAQYHAFFDQVPLSHLILGGGPRASYSYRGDAQYQHIDNQFLWIPFRYGAAVLLGYLALIVLPGLRLLLVGGDWQTRGPALIILLWALALMGLSIYNGISWNPTNYLICLASGRCLAILHGRRRREVSGQPMLLPLSSRRG